MPVGINKSWKNLFIFFLLAFFTGELHARKFNPRIKKDLFDIKQATKRIDKLISSFNEFNFHFIGIRFLSEKSAYIISRSYIDHENLYLRIQAPYNSKPETLIFPLTELEKFVYTDLFISLGRNTRLYFDEISHFTSFKILISRVLNLQAYKKSSFKKIIAAGLYLNDNLFVKDEFFEKEMAACDKKILNEVKLNLLYSRVENVLRFFQRNHSIYKKSNASDSSEKSFDELARSFFNLIRINPEVIQRIPLDVLVSFLKQVAMQSAHIEDIGFSYQSFFLDYSRDLLLLLKKESRRNGSFIMSLYKVGRVSAGDFSRIVRVESNISWLSFVRNDLKKYSIQELLLGEKDQQEVKSKIIYDSYNFKEIIDVSKVHILLSLHLFGQTYPHTWEDKLQLYMSEKDCDENRSKKRDFSFPYGRWAQGGQIIDGHLKLRTKLEVADNSLYLARSLALRHSVVLLKQDLTYKSFIEKNHSYYRYEGKDYSWSFEFNLFGRYSENRGIVFILSCFLCSIIHCFFFHSIRKVL